MTQLPEIFTSGATVSADIAQIERQLSALWQQGEESVFRACLFNLVVWCGSESDVEPASEIIGEVTGRHPCRAIVLCVGGHERNSALTASLRAHCRPSGAGSRHVCTEQITLRATQATVAQLLSTVLSLLEGDLPTVLWWRGNFTEQPDEFDRLRAVADRIIFDTSGWREAERSLPRLRQMLSASQHRHYADLSWTRLELWRKLTADCFDEPTCRGMLGRIGSVRVQHGSGCGARLRALLYAGWLATRLGWDVERAGHCVHLVGNTGEDVVRVGISAIELCAGDASVLIQKDFDHYTAQAVLSRAQQTVSMRRQAFRPLTEATLLSQELDWLAPHAAYGAALEMAEALVQRA